MTLGRGVDRGDRGLVSHAHDRPHDGREGDREGGLSRQRVTGEVRGLPAKGCGTDDCQHRPRRARRARCSREYVAHSIVVCVVCYCAVKEECHITHTADRRPVAGDQGRGVPCSKLFLFRGKRTRSTCHCGGDFIKVSGSTSRGLEQRARMPHWLPLGDSRPEACCNGCRGASECALRPRAAFGKW